MSSDSRPASGVNAWLEEELLQQYEHDRTSVDADWKEIFDHPGPAATASNAGGANGHRVNGTPEAQTAPTSVVAKAFTEPQLSGTDELMPLRGASARIAENMAASVTIPLATSQRIIPVKVVDENRRLINHHRGLTAKSKVSYTHLIGWAIVRAVQSNLALNHSFTWNSAGEPFRVVRKDINLGLAVDVAGKNGSRSLVVPNIRNAGALTFTQYMAAFDDLVVRSRNNKLTVQDFQ